METNTNNATISIIIPHWENIDGLEILLESIRQEACKHPNLSETIVVDDYSCPETQQKLRNLQNKFDFRLYFNNSIKSAGTCRNIGIEKSIGQWLLFADSDDYFLPNFLDATQKYLNSDHDIVFFPPTSVTYKNRETSSVRHIRYVKLIEKFKPNQPTELDIRYKWIAPWSRLIRKSIVTRNDIKFGATLSGNDVSFSTHIGIYAKITTASNPIYVITSRESSLTHNPTLNHYLSRIEVHVKNNKFLRSHKLDKYQRAYCEWLLPILFYFGFRKFLKTLLYLIAEHENPFLDFANEIVNLVITIKKRKLRFERIITNVANKKL